MSHMREVSQGMPDDDGYEDVEGSKPKSIEMV